MIKKILPYFTIFTSVLILYYPVLSTYFSHDDFFHFKVSITDGSFGQFINFFGFHQFNERQIAFYRPIFREVLYNSFYHAFGLNHLPFRIFSFIIHFINVYLVYTFVQKMFREKLISFATSFFFAITAANVSPLYYLAGGIQTQGATLFILLTLILYMNYLKNGERKYKRIAFLSFLLTLASHEQATILPLLLAGLILTKYKFKFAVNKLKEIWPYFLVTAVYIYLNISVIGYSKEETQYQMIFNFKTTIQTISWYGVWALGLPETFVDFLLPGFGLNPSLMRYWGNYYKIIFPTFFIASGIILSAIIYLLLKKKKVLFDKKLLFLTAWFPLGILPVIFLPQHKSTHYLYPSLPAFWASITFFVFNGYQILRKKYKKLSIMVLGVLLTSLTLLSLTSVMLARSTYWAATRGRLAGNLVKLVKEEYPSLPKGAAIYFKNDPDYPFVSEDWGSTSKQASYALNREDALQLLYNDPTLRVFYEDLGGVPQEFPENKVYSLMAQP